MVLTIWRDGCCLPSLWQTLCELCVCVCVCVSIRVFYSLGLIAHICGFIDDLSIACSVGLCWFCVCVYVCVCLWLWVWVFGAGMRQVRRPACCGVAWPSSKALVAVELLWRVKRCADLSVWAYPVHITNTHLSKAHTHISSPAFIRGATSSQACSLTLQRALSPCLSVTSLYSGLLLSFLELVFFLCPLWFSLWFDFSILPFLSVYFPRLCHVDVSFERLDVREMTRSGVCVIS